MGASVGNKGRRRPDGGNQRHALGGRDVGAADHFHDHHTIDEPPGQGRTAGSDAGQEGKQQQIPPITISVTETKWLFLNDEPTTKQAIESRLSVETQKVPQPPLQIRGDKTGLPSGQRCHEDRAGSRYGQGRLHHHAAKKG